MLEQIEKKMAAARRINQIKSAPEIISTRTNHYPYKRATVQIFDGVLLDPERPVLNTWKRTPQYDNMIGGMRMRSSDEGNDEIDAGDGYGVVPDDGVIYKIRSLSRPTLGKVFAVDPLKYWMLKVESQRVTQPRYEPVPDETADCPPIFPVGMPSDDKKARSIAAKGLKKDPASLSFVEILGWFKSKKAGAEIFKI